MDGSTQYFLTGRDWSDDGRFGADLLGMAVGIDTTLNGATRAAISAGDGEIQANRTSTHHSFINSVIATDTSLAGVSGGIIRNERREHATYSSYQNGALLDTFTRDGASGSLHTYEHIIGAHAGSGGVGASSTFWAGKIKFAAAYVPLADVAAHNAMMAEVEAAITAYIAAVEAM